MGKYCTNALLIFPTANLIAHMPAPKNLFLCCEETSDTTLSINLDDSELSPYIPHPLTTPDLLSLFFHNTDVAIDKPVVSLDGDTQQRRYFADTLVCYECGETGHINKKCPKSSTDVCVLCSLKGHERFDCPMMVCHKCYMCGHNARMCPERKNNERYLLCKVCKVGEHTVGDCPRKWRQYVVAKDVDTQGIRKSCCICFSNKHYMDDCSRARTKFSIFNSNFMSIVKLIRK